MIHIAARSRPAMRADDADLIGMLNSAWEVMRYLTGRPLTIAESRAEVAASLGNRWLLFTLDDGGFVGWVGAEGKVWLQARMAIVNTDKARNTRFILSFLEFNARCFFQ